MVHFSLFLVVLACSLVTVALPFDIGKPTQLSDVQTDIDTISSRLKELDKSLKDYPSTGGTLSDALRIHTGASDLGSSVNKATTDVKGAAAAEPVSEADATSIFDRVKPLQPVVIDALQEIVAKKPALTQLPVGLGGVEKFVKGDLKDLHTAYTSFGEALIAVAPDDLKGEGMTIKTAVDMEFDKAITAYSA